MTDNELLLAISDIFDKKLKSELRAELQPIKEDIRELKEDVRVLTSVTRVIMIKWKLFSTMWIC